MAIKFVYFDVGNVFHTYDHIFEKVALDFGKTPADIDGVFLRHATEVTKGTTSVKKLWQYCQQELNIQNGVNYNFAKSWASDYLIIKEMHDLVKKLHKKYKLGILSNHYLDTFYESLRQGKIPKIDFSTMIISAEVGCKKPEPEIYKIAQERCGFSGEEIFFIDDKKENLFTASKMGWQTFLFDYKNAQKSSEEIGRILL